MDNKYWEEINGNEKPTEVGEYHTNHGLLKYDGRGFIMGGHSKVVYTTVDWWLKPYIPPVNHAHGNSGL